MLRTTHILKTTPHIARWTSTHVSNRKESDYVRRRYKWRESMREERLAFLRGEGLGANSEATKAEDRLKEERRPKFDPVVAAAREERRIERQSKHIKMLADVQERKAVRQVAKARIWEERQVQDAARAAEEFAAIEAAAVNWINENTLDEAVERCVDEFFIAGETETYSSHTNSRLEDVKARSSL